MSATLSSTISSAITSLVGDIFNGIQYIAQGIVDFISQNYDLVGLLVGFGVLLIPLIRRLVGGGMGGILNWFRGFV